MLRQRNLGKGGSDERALGWAELNSKDPHTREAQHGTWEYAPGKGTSSSTSFSGSMLVFGGVLCMGCEGLYWGCSLQHPAERRSTVEPMGSVPCMQDPFRLHRFFPAPCGVFNKICALVLLRVAMTIIMSSSPHNPTFLALSFSVKLFGVELKDFFSVFNKGPEQGTTLH